MNNTHKVEEYECPRCKKDYEWEDIPLNWLCPECNGYIVIHADVNGYNHSILRIRADSVKVGAQVVVRSECYSVLDVSCKNGSIRIALEGYGVIFKKPAEIVSCIIGAGRRWESPS